MRTDLQLGYDLIAVEHEDTVHALLELTAPAGLDSTDRPPAGLQVVLDRSGSMGGGQLRRSDAGERDERPYRRILASRAGIAAVETA